MRSYTGEAGQPLPCVNRTLMIFPSIDRAIIALRIWLLFRKWHWLWSDEITRCVAGPKIFLKNRALKRFPLSVKVSSCDKWTVRCHGTTAQHVLLGYNGKIRYIHSHIWKCNKEHGEGCRALDGTDRISHFGQSIIGVRISYIRPVKKWSLSVGSKLYN